MNNPFSLENKTILITGASSGIGRATAIACSELDATIIALGRNKERLTETLNKLKAGNHQIFCFDLNNQDEITDFINGLTTIDGFVNSAGIVDVQLFNFLKEESLQKMMQTNFFNPIHFLQLLLKKKKMNKGGSIVFLSSIGGPVTTSLGLTSYAASKGAINAAAKTMALEYASKNIRVNTVMPGMIKTEMIEDSVFSEDSVKEDMAKYPLGYGSPVDVANAVIFLLSDASSWITGINLKLDGGVTLT